MSWKYGMRPSIEQVIESFNKSRTILDTCDSDSVCPICGKKIEDNHKRYSVKTCGDRECVNKLKGYRYLNED